jgi:hypothetical protein
MLRHTRKLAALFRLIIATVIKTIIAFPGNAAELHITQRIAQLAFVVSFNDDHFSPVGTAFGYLVSSQAAVFGKINALQRCRTVVLKLIRIKEYLWRSVAYLPP